MGGGGEKTQTVQQVQNTDPWAPQQGYLLDAFSQAQGIYHNVKGQGPYTGEFIAPVNAGLLNGAQAGLDWSTGQGQNALTTGMNLGTGAAGAGLAGTTGAMSGLFGNANADYTGSNIAAANQYANNPYIGQMVDAASTDARRQLTEQTLPGINRAAAATGNINSSRTGIAEGIAQRGFNDQVANLSAQLRGNAWNTGLGQASTDNALRQNALQAAGGLAGGMFSTGLNGINSAYSNAQTNAATQALNGSTLQAGAQSVLDNEIAKQQYAESQPWTQLANYYNIIGNKSWGGTTTTNGTTKTTESPSLLSSIGSGVSILGSLFRCDIRVKTDIAETGDSFYGLPVYTFRYIGSDDEVRGLMAQDVEAVRPDCVHEIDGIKHIDLLKIVLTSEAA